MLEMGSEAARRRFPELLDRAYAGEASIIKKRGIPYAALVPLDQRVDDTGKGLKLFDLCGTGAGLWGDDVQQTIRGYRDEWE
ncbi:MAG: type II toxin-antitoxin system prevent-host-death family antitoxin [Gammaproteobacteria bacterium]|jgi:prevent-host-death family protein|nr:type II toxin-antitoxin system prevent-host-death family antitoxin [Gammaproteobacteria bacterium]MBT5235412.1 type II toxin-antitoxin system prevent-host-death family antitoxin [Candidatus Neomarinimicrobiota bacterium]MBT3489070.1 type II toxin-antitoxin system prevent-host-death family antitoxin [Gammaproteobacteria bacterium]MBT3719772.1 type II toxin-antitoxin system prevent-host-death family antitoxin [Gammaproteobacteria bacterium]MBT3845639.1 type II toxin-antitoxin system prevent-ho